MMIVDECSCCRRPVHYSFSFDADSRILTIDNHAVKFTNLEAAIFTHLVSLGGATTPSLDIYEAVYADCPLDNWPEIKVIDVYICKIRKKLEGTRLQIITVWGFGYKLVEAQTQE